MPKGLNLRGDLAKLDDAALTERLEKAWADHEKASGTRSPSWLLHSVRGPVRHPRVYRFFGLFGSGGGSWLDALLSALLSGKRSKALKLSDRAGDLHVALCEIRDINDEIERRMRARGTRAA